jgi:hypothetical protein
MITSAVLSRASAIVAPSEPPAHLVVQQSARRVLESVTHRLAQAAKSWGADSSLGIDAPESNQLSRSEDSLHFRCGGQIAAECLQLGVWAAASLSRGAIEHAGD